MKRLTVCLLAIAMLLAATGGPAAAAWADHFPAPQVLGPGAPEKPGPVVSTLTPDLKFSPIGSISYVYVFAVDNAPETLAEQFSNNRTPVFMARVNASSVQIPAGVLLPGKSYYWYVVSIHAPGSKSEATKTSQWAYFSTAKDGK